MAFTPVNDGDLAVAPQVQQIIDALQGVTDAGQPISLTALESTDDYALRLRNLGATGLGLLVSSSADAALLEVRNAYTDIDTGVVRVDHANNRVGINTTSPSVALQVAGAITASGAITGSSFVGPLTPGAGSASAPSITSSTETDDNTGLYWPAEAQLGVTVDGTQRALFSATGLAVTGAISASNGVTVSGGGLSVIGTAALAATTATTLAASDVATFAAQVVLPQISTPSAPDAGTSVYSKSGGGLYTRAAAGSERQYVDLSSSQTLTSKTLTSPMITGGATISTGNLGMSLALHFSHQSTPSAPGASLLALYAKSDDNLYFRSGAAGSETRLAKATEILVNPLTTTGDLVYASSGSTAGRLGIGTARQVLAVNAGATAPEWVASLQSLMTTTGDIVYASAANTPARLGVGSTDQVLTVAGGVPTWANGSKATLTAAGDLLYASGANALARLPKGTGRQVLAMNSGATAPEWVASPASLMSGTGDMIYSSSANTPARLQAGTDGNILAMAGGVPTWSAPSAASVSTNDPPTGPGDITRGSLTSGWASVAESGGNYTLSNDYNVASITDNGAGDVTITIDRDMANATYAALANSTQGISKWAAIGSKVAGSYRVLLFNSSGASDSPFDTVFHGNLST